MNENEFLCWVAGIVDGEGCIYIHKSKVSHGSKNPSYSLRINIGMTHIPTILRFKEKFGGNLFYSKIKENKPQLRWSLSSNQALAFLESIYDYLFTKKEEAILAIEFGRLPKANTWKETPLDLLIKREELYKKLREIKKVHYLYSKIKKDILLKKDQFSICKSCGGTMGKYNRNGILRKFCSKKCSCRKFTMEQEKEIYELSKSGLGRKNLMKIFNIKLGTLKDVLRRNQ